MRNPVLAGILSLLLPGAGQIYNGRLRVGLMWLGVSFIMWLLAFPTFGLTAIAFHAISGWCAYSYAKDHPVRELGTGY